MLAEQPTIGPGREGGHRPKEIHDVTKPTGRLLALAIAAIVAVGCARQPVSSGPSATVPPATTPASAASSPASSAPGPSVTPRPLPSLDLGDLSAIDRALAGASAGMSAADDSGSEGGSR